jgi:hypothetical protein
VWTPRDGELGWRATQQTTLSTQSDNSHSLRCREGKVFPRIVEILENKVEKDEAVIEAEIAKLVEKRDPWREWRPSRPIVKSPRRYIMLGYATAKNKHKKYKTKKARGRGSPNTSVRQRSAANQFRLIP